MTHEFKSQVALDRSMMGRSIPGSSSMPRHVYTGLGCSSVYFFDELNSLAEVKISMALEMSRFKILNR